MKVRAKYARIVDLLEEYGSDLGMPHTKHIKDGLFELRVISSNQSVRAFFCTVINNEIVVLHIIIKKSQKAPKKDIDLALRRMKEVSNE